MSTPPIELNIAPRICCDHTGPSSWKSNISKIAQFHKKFYVISPFTSILTGLATGIFIHMVGTYTRKELLEKCENMLVVPVVCSVYAMTCHTINRYLNKFQPSEEDYSKYLRNMASQAVTNNKMERIYSFIEEEENRESADNDERFRIYFLKELIGLLARKYINSANPPSVPVLIKLLKNTHIDTGNDVCERHAEKMKSKDPHITSSMIKLIKARIYDTKAISKYELFFTTYAEHELQSAQGYSRHIRETLFQIGLANGEIPRLIIQYGENAAIQRAFVYALQKMYIDSQLGKSLMLYKIARFFTDNPDDRNLKNASEIATYIPSETLYATLQCEIEHYRSPLEFEGEPEEIEPKNATPSTSIFRRLKQEIDQNEQLLSDYIHEELEVLDSTVIEALRKADKE